MKKTITKDRLGRPLKIWDSHTCTYCDHDKYPCGKIIDPTVDKNAIKMSDGTWKCGTCVT